MHSVSAHETSSTIHSSGSSAYMNRTRKELPVSRNATPRSSDVTRSHVDLMIEKSTSFSAVMHRMLVAIHRRRTAHRRCHGCPHGSRSARPQRRDRRHRRHDRRPVSPTPPRHDHRQHARIRAFARQQSSSPQQTEAWLASTTPTGSRGSQDWHRCRARLRTHQRQPQATSPLRSPPTAGLLPGFQQQHQNLP